MVLEIASSSTELYSLVGVCVLVLLSTAYFLRKKGDGKLPPINKEGTLQTIKIFTNGKGAPEFFYAKMKELGSVYRLRMPESVHWITVCDPALARQLLTEEEDKPKMVERMNGFTNFIPNIASKPTHSESFKSAKKGMAPSFSMANICLSLPKMHAKIDELKKIFTVFESSGTVFDLPEIMTQLTMDFICAGTNMV